jgi:hypothetical protein
MSRITAIDPVQATGKTKELLESAKPKLALRKFGSEQRPNEGR